MKKLTARDNAFRNLKQASASLDPYMKRVRKSQVQTHGHHHYDVLKKETRKKWYNLLKEVRGWRFLLPLTITPLFGLFFYMDLVFGLSAVIAGLAALTVYAINKWFTLQSLNELTDVRNEDHFHFHAYSHHSPEFHTFAPFLEGANVFEFQDAYELLMKWEKNAEEYKTLIDTLEKQLTKTAQDSTKLPHAVQQEYKFAVTLFQKLIEKIRLHQNGNFDKSSLDFYGHYAVYEVGDEALTLCYTSRPRGNIERVVSYEDKRFFHRSFIRILKSRYAWVHDDRHTISFIAETNGQTYVYVLYLDNDNRHVLKVDDEFGKINIDRLAEVVQVSFTL